MTAEQLGTLGLAAGVSVYVAELVAGKVPAFDTVWDAIHAFVRVPAAAVLRVRWMLRTLRRLLRRQPVAGT